MEFVVIADWTASYADPIRLRAGDPVHLTGQQEEWDGHRWLWAISARGREGWIPDNFIAQGPAGPVARRDYSAIELTCRVAERLAGGAETHGWVWCRAEDGRAGWVPRSNLRATGGMRA